MSASTSRQSDASHLVAEAAPRLSGAAPEDVLRWAFSEFAGERVALCTSFQVEGMVVLDMAVKLDPAVRVFTIDSGRLPAETHSLIDEVRSHYGIAIEVVHPEAAEVSELVTEHGVNLFYRAPDLRLACCNVRKVRPLQRRLASLEAWITGLRASQGPTRGGLQEIELDLEHGGMIKINPLAGWTREQVRTYVTAHGVPMNALYSQGYESIGCAPCTRAIEPGEDPRAGRWWWETGDKECGIHYTMAVDAAGQPVVVTGRNEK